MRWRTRRTEVEPIVAPDGSLVRELAHPRAGRARAQSVAEATIGPGEATRPHLHRTSEEVYTFLSGRGEMHLAERSARVEAGDTVVIPPGTPHHLANDGEEPLVLICSCAPAYSDGDTVLLEPHPF